MMMISVHYFARVREMAGVEIESFEVEDNCSLDDVISAISKKHGFELRSLPLLYSVNCEYADTSLKLKDGDEIGLLFPSSGG